MAKSKTVSFKANSVRVKPKSLGRSKVTKFALVEGMSLSAASRRTYDGFQSAGLKGDALRSAISGLYKSK